jgi:hypothetical protein
MSEASVPRLGPVRVRTNCLGVLIYVDMNCKQIDERRLADRSKQELSLQFEAEMRFD